MESVERRTERQPPTMNTELPTTIGAAVRSSDLLGAPVRLCCGQRHFGPVCPDGMVMCCLCFERVSKDKLNVAADGRKENVCKKCADEESAPINALINPQQLSIMEQNEFETVDEAYLEVVRLRAQNKGIGDEMKETLYMLRTGATNEQLDYRVRNALAQYGVLSDTDNTP